MYNCSKHHTVLRSFFLLHTYYTGSDTAALLAYKKNMESKENDKSSNKYTWPVFLKIAEESPSYQYFIYS